MNKEMICFATGKMLEEMGSKWLINMIISRDSYFS
jgi:hypothetical protein